MRFQEITVLALNANYVGSDWFDQYPSLRFVTAVVNRNELFASTLKQHGQSYEFKAVEPDQTDMVAETEPKPFNSGILPVGDPDTDGMKEQINLRTTKNHADLEEVMFEKETINKEIGRNTLEWLEAVYKTSRGFELGTFDSSLLATTMKTQSLKWEGLALGYISDVVSMALTFIIDLLCLTCPDARVRNGLMSMLMEGLMAKYKGAFDSVRFLLHVERTGTPTTLNHYFNDNLEKRFVISGPIPSLLAVTDGYLVVKIACMLL